MLGLVPGSLRVVRAGASNDRTTQGIPVVPAAGLGRAGSRARAGAFAVVAA